jgi:FtsZ-binding cell division protein ZapB
MSKWLEAKKIKWKFYIDSSDFSNIVKEYSDKIDELEEENRKLKESLDIATKCSSKEEDWIIRLSEENKKLKDENVDLKSELSKFRDSFKKYRDYEKEELAESCYDLARENQKLKEERDFFKEQAMLWRKDYTNEYEKNRNLIGKLESLEK